MSQYAGIDYGRGMSNIDHKTGIRYGVIPQNEVLQAWADSSEPHYIYFCPKCGTELPKEMQEDPTGTCPSCEAEITTDDFDNLEPSSYYYDQDGYYCEQSCDDMDIFILKSPYYTYAQFCSPCAPGAGYLRSSFPISERIKKIFKETDLEIAGEEYRKEAEAAGFPKVYCFDKTWFDDENVPYPVYSVETGELIP